MANVQQQFDEFHSAIKLGRFKEEATLREKRDIIQRKLRERLPDVFTAHDETLPALSFRDQGSYETGTGIQPLNGDYDIDQGLYFSVSTETYPNPVILKQRVHEALDGHTKKVAIRRSCVTVFYQLEDEPLYHVDLAVYAAGSATSDGKDYLAKGKEHATADQRGWEVSDPQGLSDTILGKFQETDRRQFRHVVQYLKRWRDVQYPDGGNPAPLGIGLTVAAYQDFQAAYLDRLTGKLDDLTALQWLVRAIRGRFTSVWDVDKHQIVPHLVVALPVEPWNDLFARMSNAQMERFSAKLDALQVALDAAVDAVDPVAACEQLQKVFGADFPVPEKQETAKIHIPAIVSSSNSA